MPSCTCACCTPVKDALRPLLKTFAYAVHQGTKQHIALPPTSDHQGVRVCHFARCVALLRGRRMPRPRPPKSTRLMKRNPRRTQCLSRFTATYQGSLLQTQPVLRRLRGSMCLSQAAAAIPSAVKLLGALHKRRNHRTCGSGAQVRGSARIPDVRRLRGSIGDAGCTTGGRPAQGLRLAAALVSRPRCTGSQEIVCLGRLKALWVD